MLVHTLGERALVWNSYFACKCLGESCGCVQSSFEPFFGRLRSRRAKSSRVGVSMPDACTSRVRNSSQLSPVSRPIATLLEVGQLRVTLDRHIRVMQPFDQQPLMLVLRKNERV